jgi:Acetyl-CoA hydrolase/transferase C-terminal domain
VVRSPRSPTSQTIRGPWHSVLANATILEHPANHEPVESDLYGQVNGQFINGHQYSGSGGQGASFSTGGKSFIGRKSSAKNGTISSIVPNVNMATDTRMDVEHIVTEFGMVNLRGRSTRARALALIAIAHPNFRAELTRHEKSINLISKGFLVYFGNCYKLLHPHSIRVCVEFLHYLTDVVGKNRKRLCASDPVLPKGGPWKRLVGIS